MFQYKLRLLQEGLPEEYPSLLNYAHNIRRELSDDFGYLYHMLFSDECVFHTNGAVINQNARVWGQKHLHTVVGLPHTSEKFVVWCGMLRNKIIGPYVFSEPIVTRENYKMMRQHYAISKVLNLTASPIFHRMVLLHIGKFLCKVI